MDRWGRAGVLGAALVVAAVFPASLHAQEEALEERCVEETQGFGEEARRFCNLLAQGIEVFQPTAGLSLSGGNPVPGTASTLGLRIGTLPRFSIAARLTGVSGKVPQILAEERQEDTRFVLPSINVDGSLGVFGGFSPAPTVGGVGSVDALVSIGILPQPGDEEGFDERTLFSWAFGTRVGILRESFTLPGVSVSAMYRRTEDFVFGDPQLQQEDAFFVGDLSNLSLRAAVGKRLFTFGATAGVGYDRYWSDLNFGFVQRDLLGDQEFRIRYDGFENDRFSAFANLSLTLLVLHAVAEAGWQEGGDRVGDLPDDRGFDPKDGRFFGSVAIRLSI